MRGVQAIVLGGSRARGSADEHSDIDLGLYYDDRRPFRIPELARAARDLDDRGLPGLVTPFGGWGPGVNGGGWLMIDGMHVDFLYRELGAVRRAINECRAGHVKVVYQLGHPMGFHNQIYPGEVHFCVPLMERGAAISKLKPLIAPYPKAMRIAMVRKHLHDAAFELAIADKPAFRGDVMYTTACLVRAAGFMTMVVYALNRRWLINEKGALLGLDKFRILPRDFRRSIERVLAQPGESSRALKRSIAAMQALCARMRAIAARHGIELIDSAA